MGEHIHQAHEATPLTVAAEGALGMPFFKNPQAQANYLSTAQLGDMHSDREHIAMAGARLAAHVLLQVPHSTPQNIATYSRGVEARLPRDERNNLQSARRRLQVIQNYEDYLETLTDDPKHDGLKPHQVEGIEMFYRFLTTRGDTDDRFSKGGFFDWATGTGKTVLITKIAQACGVGTIPNDGSNRPLRALVLAPRRQILNQIIGKVSQGGFAEFAPHLRAGFLFADSPEEPNDIDISTYYGLVRNAQRSQHLLHKYDLIFCDEAHTALGKKTTQLLNSNPGQALSVGLTASMMLGSGKHVSDMLKREIHRIPFVEAVSERGIINSFEFYTVNTLRQVIAESSYLSIYGDFSPQSLQEFIYDEQINSHIFELCQLFVAKGLRGIVFCMPGDSSKHARVVSKQLNDDTKDTDTMVRAAAVGNFAADDENRKILDAFDNNEIDVVATTQLLELGWDSDKVDFIILAAPTLSQAKLIQRIGRGARPKASGLPTVVVQFDYATGKQKQISPLDLIQKKGTGQGVSLYYESKPKPELPHDLQVEIKLLLDKIQTQVEQTHTLYRNNLGYNPDHCKTHELAAELSITTDYLHTLLLGRKMQVYRARDPETGDYFSLCSQTAATFLRENFIRAGELSIHEIAAKYEVAPSFVTHRLTKLGVYNSGKQRIARTAKVGTLPLCFGPEALKAFDADYMASAQPLQPGEMTVAQAAEQCGVSSMAIMRWMKNHPKRQAQLLNRRPGSGVGNQANRPTLSAAYAPIVLQRFKLPPMETHDVSLNELPRGLLQQGNGYVFDLIDTLRVQPAWKLRQLKDKTRRTLCITADERRTLIATWKADKSRHAKKPPQKLTVTPQIPSMRRTPVQTLKEAPSRPEKSETRQRTVLQPPPGSIMSAQGKALPPGVKLGNRSLLQLGREMNIHAQHLSDIIGRSPQLSRCRIARTKDDVVVSPDAFGILLALCSKGKIATPPPEWRTIEFFAAQTGRSTTEAHHILAKHLEPIHSIDLQVLPDLRLTYYSPQAYILLRTYVG